MFEAFENTCFSTRRASFNLAVLASIHFALRTSQTCSNNKGITVFKTFIWEDTVGNLVLWRHVSRAVKRDFRTYIQRHNFPNETFEYGYPQFNALLTFSLTKTVKMFVSPTFTL